MGIRLLSRPSTRWGLPSFRDDGPSTALMSQRSAGLSRPSERGTCRARGVRLVRVAPPQLHSNHARHALHHRLPGRNGRTADRIACGRRCLHPHRYTRDTDVAAARIPAKVTRGLHVGSRHPIPVRTGPGRPKGAPSPGWRLGRVRRGLPRAAKPRQGRAAAHPAPRRRRACLPPVFRSRPRRLSSFAPGP